MKNNLKIGDILYKLKNDSLDNLNNYLSVEKDDDDNILSIYLECYFDETINSSEPASVEPSIIINEIDLSSKKLKSLDGFTFEVESAEKSFNREDSFYYHESEPFEKYKLIINNCDDKNADISIVGTAIIDGYSNPYKTSKIEMNCILPVKISITKKELLNLTSKGYNGNQLLSSKYKFIFYKDELKIYNNKGLIRKINYNDIKEVELNKNKISIICDKKITIVNTNSDLLNKIKKIINK